MQPLDVGEDPLTVALLDAVLAAFVFLEDSSDDQVNPDDAVRAMENIVSPLAQLEFAQRQRLIRLLDSTANASPPTWDHKLRETLRESLRDE